MNIIAIGHEAAATHGKKISPLATVEVKPGKFAETLKTAKGTHRTNASRTERALRVSRPLATRTKREKAAKFPKAAGSLATALAQRAAKRREKVASSPRTAPAPKMGRSKHGLDPAAVDLAVGWRSAPTVAHRRVRIVATRRSAAMEPTGAKVSVKRPANLKAGSRRGAAKSAVEAMGPEHGTGSVAGWSRRRAAQSTVEMTDPQNTKASVAGPQPERVVVARLKEHPSPHAALENALAGGGARRQKVPLDANTTRAWADGTRAPVGRKLLISRNKSGFAAPARAGDVTPSKREPARKWSKLTRPFEWSARTPEFETQPIPTARRSRALSFGMKKVTTKREVKVPAQAITTPVTGEAQKPASEHPALPVAKPQPPVATKAPAATGPKWTVRKAKATPDGQTTTWAVRPPPRAHAAPFSVEIAQTGSASVRATLHLKDSAGRVGFQNPSDVRDLARELAQKSSHSLVDVRVYVRQGLWARSESGGSNQQREGRGQASFNPMRPEHHPGDQESAAWSTEGIDFHA